MITSIDELIRRIKLTVHVDSTKLKLLSLFTGPLLGQRQLAHGSPVRGVMRNHVTISLND